MPTRPPFRRPSRRQRPDVPCPSCSTQRSPWMPSSFSLELKTMSDTVGSILRHKGHDVWSVSPDESVFQAISLMAEKGIGALVVIADDMLVGIISERDYARKVVLQGKSSR